MNPTKRKDKFVDGPDVPWSVDKNDERKSVRLFSFCFIYLNFLDKMHFREFIDDVTLPYSISDFIIPTSHDSCGFK